jgi:hypothetical protein
MLKWSQLRGNENIFFVIIVKAKVEKLRNILSTYILLCSRYFVYFSVFPRVLGIKLLVAQPKKTKKVLKGSALINFDT